MDPWTTTAATAESPRYGLALRGDQPIDMYRPVQVRADATGEVEIETRLSPAMGWVTLPETFAFSEPGDGLKWVLLGAETRFRVKNATGLIRVTALGLTPLAVSA